MSSGSTLEKAIELYNGALKTLVLEFVKSKGMRTEWQTGQFADYEEWVQDGTSIVFGTNLWDINFMGMRREIELMVDPDKGTLIIFAAAFQDKDGRRLKSFFIAQYHDLPYETGNPLLKLIRSSLEGAWRTAQTITEDELLDGSTWQTEENELRSLAESL